MVVLKVVGGTGNQFFIYAFGKALEAAGNNVRFDRSYYDTDPSRGYTLHHWNTKVEFGTPVGEVINEPDLRYHPELLKKYDTDCTLVGYWQCPRYFRNVSDLLKREFTLKHRPSEKSLEVAGQIVQTNSVFLHIRRTDNLSVRGMAFHGLSPIDYYARAIKRIVQETNKSLDLFVFSDDIEWCKANIPWEATFVDHNSTGVTADPTYFLTKTANGTEHEDLWCMSLCKHGVTATSTFSWWGGYLIQNPAKVVISPHNWFIGEYNRMSEDMIPWIRI